MLITVCGKPFCNKKTNEIKHTVKVLREKKKDNILKKHDDTRENLPVFFENLDRSGWLFHH